MTQAMTQPQADGGPAAARQVGAEAMEKAGEVATVAGSEGRAVVDEARERARDLVSESRERLRSEATGQTQRIAETMRTLGGQLNSMAQGQPTEGWLPDVSRRVAATMTDAARKLEERGPDSALHDLKAFARRRPGMFLAGALGAGFVVGRMLRAVDTHALVEAAKGNGDETGAFSGETSAFSDEQVPAVALTPPAPAVPLTPTSAIDSTAEGWR
jgi:hypothetical protein